MEEKKSAESEPNTMNLFERLNAIACDVGYINKNLIVQLGAHSYKAVGEADVLAAVKPLEKKYGVYSYPFSREIIASEKTSENGRVTYFERIKVTYRFLNVDKPDQFIDIVSYGDGIDASDKSVGKAMTYADKYALLKAYKIMTGEDPDSDDPSKTDNGMPKNIPSKPVEAKTEAKGVSTQEPTPTAPKSVSPSNADMPASEKQMQFIKNLIDDKGITNEAAVSSLGFSPSGKMTKAQASQAIDWLYKQSKVEKKEEVKAEPVADDDLPF